MLDWLKKLAGEASIQNKVGLGRRQVELLADDFAALDQLSSGISTRLTRYVVDDDGEEVLAELAGLTNAGHKFHLRCSQRFFSTDGITPRSEFFKSVECSSPEVFTRLGRVYDSVTQVHRRLHRIFGDPKLDWLEILLLEATQFSVNVWPRRCRACPAMTADMVEAILETNGFRRDLLIKAAFQPDLQRFPGLDAETLFLSLKGLGQSAVRHRRTVLLALDHTDFKQRLHALGMLKKTQAEIAPFQDKVVELALASSKQVRELAAKLLEAVKTTARPLIEERVLRGSNEEKPLAVTLLWTCCGEDARAFLETRLKEEKNKKVIRAIEDALATCSVEPAREPVESTLELPPLQPMPSQAPLGAETEHAWHECFQEVNAAIARLNAGLARKSNHMVAKPVSADAVRRSFALMQNGGKNEDLLKDLFCVCWKRELGDPIRHFWERPELGVIHLVRFLILMGALRVERQRDYGMFGSGYWLEPLMPLFRRAHPEVGLRELGAALTAVGMDPRRIGYGILQNYQEMPAPLGLPPERIWPYWAENMDLLEQAFEPSTGGFMDRIYQRTARRNAFFAISAFPQPPARLVPQLWKLALGGKSERLAAQQCLEALPDKVERLLTSLSTPEAEARIAAAEWLGRIGDAEATAPLLAVMKRERNESAKGAMMSALELLGLPVEQFLDRKALLAEAEKGVGKGVPEGLKWFPFGRLPSVHWADNDEPLAPATTQWWLIQGFKLKSPQPGPLLRKYCSSLKPTEREALGQFILEAWLGEDTSPISRADAEKRAMQQAQQYVQWSQSSYWPANSPKKTLEEFYADFLPGLLMQPKGSGIASKGILSVAAACGGAAAAPAVGHYLNQWYGMRAAQCRALIEMLPWIEHKTATQLLLSVGSRFRTKGIQEEANKQAQALAKRRGWTVAELADRTIPTAGLDDEGRLTLDFGPRQFSARLNEDLEFSLLDAEGKPLKSLPDPRNDDDQAKAVEAKKTFSAAKKELKSVLTMQRDRLYEAMCTQRTWPFEEWNLYLNQHPVVRHHCQKLVWAVVRDAKVAMLFRPLDDGSLTDSNDDPVTLEPESPIRVAHECLVTPGQSLAWRQHLKDYEVEPLFEQFGRPNFLLEEERRQEDDLADFRGHILEAFRLRGRANKLGYTRGQAQDGGWFFDYHKRFPTLGIETILEFTGNGLPEENRMVALTSMRFERAAGEGEANHPGAKMVLGQVPDVLLSECWNDLRQIAGEGSGFDPDWEKKTQM
jgi:hypothetical protein